MTFSKDELPPAYGFWSLTMYDKDQYLVPNELKRQALRDTDDLKYNNDGSLTLYIQNEKPTEDKVSNWLPAPKDGIRLTLRVYAPKENAQDGSWIPPAVERVD